MATSFACCPIRARTSTSAWETQPELGAWFRTTSSTISGASCRHWPSRLPASRITAASWRKSRSAAIGEGWITVRFVTLEENPDIGSSCGLATPGSNPGSIWIARDNGLCFRNGYFRRLFAHELGHAFGLWHVGVREAMMSEAGNDTEWFTERERYHAQLAYEAGRGAAYCGWPFGPACDGGT